jgi:hypothetical protein
MKPAQEVAEELCRWFTPDNEPIELVDVAHTREVLEHYCSEREAFIKLQESFLQDKDERIAKLEQELAIARHPPPWTLGQ